MSPMRIVVAEPWLSGSHAQWAEGFAAGSRHDVRVVGLESGSWRWRLRAGAGPLAAKVKADIDRNGPPDVLVVSGLVDVAQLLGLLRRSLASSTAVVVYQHESQLVYPTVRGRVDDEAVLRNWSSWLAADLVIFNSEFHRRSVVDSLEGFLRRQPELDQLQFLEQTLEKFVVVPIGLDLDGLVGERPAGSGPGPGPGPGRGEEGPIILWPHRWEPDKDPAAFVRALAKLDQQGLNFRLVLAGSDPVVPSEERRLVRERWASQIVAVGPFPRSEYVQWLRRCDIVLSCARHEFFGVAVAEAMAAGCVPVLPDALAYPELIEERWRSLALYAPGTFGTRLGDVVSSIEEYRRATAGLAASLQRFDWSSIAPLMDNTLHTCWRGSRTLG